MLAAQLARHLPDEAERREWDTMLKRHLTDSGRSTSYRFVSEMLPASSTHAVAALLDPAHIEAATQQFVVHESSPRGLLPNAPRGART
jgi:hypothetical protein